MDLLGAAPDRVLGTFAHELNNRLVTAVGNLELAAERSTDPDLRDRLLRPALRSLLSGVDLTRRLLAAAGRQPLRPAVVPAADLVARVADIAARALAPHIVVERRLMPEAGLVRLDPAAAEVALLALVVNARDAMPTGGTLTLSALVEGESVRLSVADTGLGMTDTVLAHATEPFFTTKGHGAEGLGLSVAAGFARQSGGRLELESREGAGSTIGLVFPRQP